MLVPKSSWAKSAKFRFALPPAATMRCMSVRGHFQRSFQPFARIHAGAGVSAALTCVRRASTVTPVSTLNHVYTPEEVNPAGNVHGGARLKLMESAGALAASRHCVGATEVPACATVRIENVDFRAPVSVGNLAEAIASVQRKLKVAAGDHEAHVSAESWLTTSDPTLRLTPAGAAVQLVQLMLPSDCALFNKNPPVQGGVIMKLMDNAAAVCSFKLCRSPVATVTIDAMDFLCPVHNGELVYVQARPTFSSGKSLEVEVLVEVEALAGGRQPCTHAYFTFVSLGATGTPQVIPQLQLANAGDEERAAAAKARYAAKRAAWGNSKGQ